MSGSGDRRLYARLSLDFDENPKIAPLSDAAFRQLVEALLWSRRLMTDGRIPAAMISRKFSQEVLAELTSNGPEGQSSSLVWDGKDVIIHDFAEHQNTRAQIEKYSEAGRKGAAARHGKAAAKPARSANRKRIASESQYESLSQTETETPTSNDVGARKRGTRIPENFVVDDALREYAAQKAPAADVDREREQFVNYWLASSGKSAVKIDWRRAFMTWLGNAQRYAEERGWKPSAATVPSNESQLRMNSWLADRGITLDEWNERKHDSAWVDSLREQS
jgi:hypothetical protein